MPVKSDKREAGVVFGPGLVDGHILRENDVLVTGPMPEYSIVTCRKEYNELGEDGIRKKYSPRL